MKIYDIANLLAEKINQSHYIQHYLKIVFANGFKKGVEDKEDFAIDFAEWLRVECYDTGDKWLYQDDEIYDSQELLEIYKKEKGL